MYKDKNKAKEYACLTMAIRRAKKKGLDISNLLTQRATLKVITNHVGITNITNKGITKQTKTKKGITKKNNGVGKMNTSIIQ